VIERRGRLKNMSRRNGGRRMYEGRQENERTLFGLWPRSNWSVDSASGRSSRLESSPW
jgi:hypothetical protein